MKPILILFLCGAFASWASAQGVQLNVTPDACPGAQLRGEAPATKPAPTPHLGIALGSGSLHGIAHIGVLQELEARGVEVKVVAGTSVGALVGALWASGMPAAEIEQLHRAEDWEDMSRLAWGRGGIFDNDRLRERLAAIFGTRTIEQWPRRFAAVATDLATGARVALSRGDGARAVRASTAIAGLFVPVEVAGRRLADGVLVEPVPVDTARELGAAFVIAIDVAYRPHEEEAITAPQLGFQAIHIVTNSLSGEQLKRADVAIRIDLHHVFKKCGREALVAAGREAMRIAWPQVARQLERAQR